MVRSTKSHKCGKKYMVIMRQYHQVLEVVWTWSNVSFQQQYLSHEEMHHLNFALQSKARIES